MKTSFLCLALMCITLSVFGQANDSDPLTKAQILEDLAFVKDKLEQLSSYQGLNGFEYAEAFDKFEKSLDNRSYNKSEFGLFLTKTIGQIGDRHAYAKSYELPNSLFLPFTVAPIDGKVVALTWDADIGKYHLLYPEHPYLMAINGEPIDSFLTSILPEESLAPKDAFFSRAVKQLKYMEKNYFTRNEEIPEQMTFTFADKQGTVTENYALALTDIRSKYITWDERFSRRMSRYEEDEFNHEPIVQQLFSIEDNIAYIHLPEMFYKDYNPLFFEKFEEFMEKAKSTQSLIIDVRSNGGGSRGFAWDLASYIVHPDSIYVVNVAQQRGQLPLSKEWKSDLHNRNLYAFTELDEAEQKKVSSFSKSFEPMYDLDKDKFSTYHYALFNGQKLSEGKFHYNRPVYILANERSFSAASVLVALLKGLPNVQIVGVNTDGSSGNSEKFRLPNSNIKIKLSTMVSFQKNGKILDGFGTAPDIVIERDLEQVLWNRDSQLEQLKALILSNEQ